MADRGSYVLFVDCVSPTSIDVGALGERAFTVGTYAYVGSAFGSGGLSRVDRHRRVASGDHDVRHWHIDYLLAAQPVRLAGVQTFVNADVECSLAAVLSASGCERVDGFGCSDCDCASHLFGPTTAGSIAAAIRQVDHGSL